MNRHLRTAVILSMLIWLCGCATATVLKQDAAGLSTATGRLVGESRDFYRRLDEQKRQYLVNVLLESQNCRLGWKALLLPVENAGFRCLTTAELDVYNACSAEPIDTACPGGEMPNSLAGAQMFDLVSAEKSSALALIAILAEYQAVLAAIVADPKLDTAVKLQGLEDRANKALGAIAKIAGEDSAAKRDFNAQTQALGKLIDLIRQLREDRRDLAKLRQLMSQKGGVADEFDAALERLRLRYEGLDRGLLIELKRRETDRLLRNFNATPIAGASTEQRSERAQKILAARAEMKALEAAPDALGQAFIGLRDTHRQLRGAVVDGKYSASQRERIASQALDQLKVWFEAISSVVKVF